MSEIKCNLKEKNVNFLWKEINSKAFSRFTGWIYKSTEDLSISPIIYKIEVGLKLNKIWLFTNDSYKFLLKIS